MLIDRKSRKNTAILRALTSVAAITVLFAACSFSQPSAKSTRELPGPDTAIITGAAQTQVYLPLLKGKTIGVVANPTSMIGGTHLADSLLKMGIKIKCVFGPEHGFRGNAEAGGSIANDLDTRTGLPVVSLYGKHDKPTPADLAGIDIMLFDIQDVGVRCYTYISTLTYVMEACAAARIPLVVLDRPNPNGFYMDGPVLEPALASFVGLHPVPLVYGLTIGEYATMVNGEGWLGQGMKCDLHVVRLKHYTHASRYDLPVKPSPNLPDMVSVYLYPSLCLFEGTVVSIGRGTDKPFRIMGNPGLPDEGFSFTPFAIRGVSEHPPCEGKLCFGKDLSAAAGELKMHGHIELKWLISSYNLLKDKEKFFNNFFDKLAGTPVLRHQIESGLAADRISEGWKKGLEEYRQIRKKYLMYPD
jgi:uncharacterized protein YbbC (DUF1343 family)